MPGAFDNKANLAAMPVGSIVQVPYSLTDPNWLPCLGQKVSRSLYPALSACLPGMGDFTATNRTKTNTATSRTVATDGTSWVLTGANGTTNIVTTTDGITFTDRTTPAACNVRSIIYDGVNFVAARFDAGSPLYSSNGGTTWTASASSVSVPYGTTQTQTCMAWAPTLGAVGRFCIAAGITNVVTSDDRGVTWTNRPHGIAASGYAMHVAWTGQKFIVTTDNATYYATSADGITWTSVPWPFGATGPVASATAGSIVSDGNGRVLVADGVKPTVYISLDHGATWAVRAFGSPQIASAVTPAGEPTYANGRFFVGYWSSKDLITWSYMPDFYSSLATFAGSATANLSYKSGVWFANGPTTSAATLIEDPSKMYLPQPAQGSGIATGYANWNNYMPWIKVR